MQTLTPAERARRAAVLGVTLPEPSAAPLSAPAPRPNGKPRAPIAGKLTASPTLRAKLGLPVAEPEPEPEPSAPATAPPAADRPTGRIASAPSTARAICGRTVCSRRAGLRSSPPRGRWRSASTSKSVRSSRRTRSAPRICGVLRNLDASRAYRAALARGDRPLTGRSRTAAGQTEGLIARAGVMR